MDFSEQELWILSACIVEAKFNGEWRDMDVPASPMVADISRRIRDVLQASGRFGSESTWQTWRNIGPERDEWRIGQRFMQLRKRDWQSLDDSGRRDYVRRILAPFDVSEELLARFLAEATEP